MAKQSEYPPLTDQPTYNMVMKFTVSVGDLEYISVANMQQIREKLRTWGDVIGGDALGGTFTVEVPIAGDLWDAADYYHEIRQQLEDVVEINNTSGLKMPDRPQIFGEVSP